MPVLQSCMLCTKRCNSKAEFQQFSCVNRYMSLYKHCIACTSPMHNPSVLMCKSLFCRVRCVTWVILLWNRLFKKCWGKKWWARTLDCVFITLSWHFCFNNCNKLILNKSYAEKFKSFSKEAWMCCSNHFNAESTKEWKWIQDIQDLLIFVK